MRSERLWTPRSNACRFQMLVKAMNSLRESFTITWKRLRCRNFVHSDLIKTVESRWLFRRNLFFVKNNSTSKSWIFYLILIIKKKKLIFSDRGTNCMPFRNITFSSSIRIKRVRNHLRRVSSRARAQSISEAAPLQSPRIIPRRNMCSDSSMTDRVAFI